MRKRAGSTFSLCGRECERLTRCVDTFSSCPKLSGLHIGSTAFLVRPNPMGDEVQRYTLGRRCLAMERDLQAHNLKVAGSNPAPATTDRTPPAEAAGRFLLPAAPSQTSRICAK